MLSMEEERAVLLSAFVQDFGIGAEKKLQQDMVAHYLQCGAAQETVRATLRISLFHLAKERASKIFQSAGGAIISWLP